MVVKENAQIEYKKESLGVFTGFEVGLQQFDRLGVTKRRTVETDPSFTKCVSSVPTAGERLLTSWGQHVFFWEDEGEVVVLQTDNVMGIKPILYIQPIQCSFIPGGIQSVDVFKYPQEARLIHIGLSVDEVMIQEIKKRAEVERFINIQVNSTQESDKDWTWDQFEVAYERKSFKVEIFPVSGDHYLSFKIRNNPGQKAATPLFIKKGKKYYESKGVVGWSFMRDAYNLSYENMQKKYPRNRLCLGKPESFAAQVDQMTHDTHIQFTDLQRQLYINLRLIPAENKPAAIQEREDSGYYCSKHTQRNESPFVHPTQLGEIGLLGEILKFTQDKYRTCLLQNYLTDCKKR